MRIKLALLSLGTLLLAGHLTAQIPAPKKSQRFANLVAGLNSAKCADLLAARGNRGKAAKLRGAAGRRLNKNTKTGKPGQRAIIARHRKLAVMKACKTVKRARIRRGG